MSAYKKCILYLFLVVFLLYGSAVIIFQLFRREIHVEIQNRVFENTDIITAQIDESLTETVFQLLEQLEIWTQVKDTNEILEEISNQVHASSYISSVHIQTDQGYSVRISRLGATLEESLSAPLSEKTKYLTHSNGQLELNLYDKDHRCRMTVLVDTSAILRAVMRSVMMENAMLLPSNGLEGYPYRGNLSSLQPIADQMGGAFQHKHAEVLQVNGKELVVIYMPIHTLSSAVAAVFDSQKIFAADAVWNSIILWVSLLALVCIAFGGWVLHEVIHRPLNRLVDAFTDLDRGKLNVKIDTNHCDEFQYIFQSFNQMTEGLKNSIDINYRQVIRTQQAELKQLHLQINPHFLYNCFSNISSLCACGNYERIKPFAHCLASYYRYITGDSELDTSFGNEYKHALDYIAIQEIRFDGRIGTSSTPLEQLQTLWNVRVPKLILQPLIENSYKHALEFIPEGGWLELTASLSDERLVIRVEDNGQVLEDAQITKLDTRMRGEESTANGIGLVNVYRRLQLYYHGHADIILSRSKLGGLAVTIQIEEAIIPC